jgi:hypothetical protein
LNRLLNRAGRVAVVMLLPAIAGGQMVSPTMSDATVVARGSLRVRGQIEWTRYDAIFGPGGKGTLPIGSALSANLDVVALPALGQAQVAAQTMTGTPSVQLNVGTLTTTADSRIATVPVSLEYGLTSRITLGVMVPVLDTRTVVTLQLNGRKDSTANVGVNPAGFLFNQTAFSTNLQVTSGLVSAMDTLIAQLQACSPTSSSNVCTAGHAKAQALVADAATFTSAASDLYGISSTQPGAPFIPLAGGVIQQAIDAHLAAIRSGFTSFNIAPGSGAFVAAKGFAANAQLQQLVKDVRYGIGLDSLGTTEQLSVGDAELSLTAQLFNSFTDSLSGGLKWRGAFEGVIRLGTGHRARENQPFDIGTGDGQTDLEMRGAVDLLFHTRVLTTVAATYTQQLGSVPYRRLPASPGRIFALDTSVAGTIKPGNMAALRVNPRFLLTRGLMVGGLFMATHRGADQTTVTGGASSGAVFGNPNSANTWAGGLTISYSNLATHSGTGDARFPAEVQFSHLETLGATAIGPEKTSRDAIEVRLYFRTRR